MSYPTHRLRRLRQREGLRRMVSETDLTHGDLIAPLLVHEQDVPRMDMASMPGVNLMNIEEAVNEAKLLYDMRIPAVLLISVTDPPQAEDAVAATIASSTGIVHKTLRAIREAVPDLVLIADTTRRTISPDGRLLGAHSGPKIHNDRLVEQSSLAAISLARAGADIIAPAGMLDGMVQSVRGALDTNGYESVAIMSFSARFASAFNGDAGDEDAMNQSDLAFSNAREAVREAILDVEEGADIVLVKPALPYLDVIRELRNEVRLPIAAFSVAGEYSMIKAAARAGWLNERHAAMEIVTSIRRAGADMIVTFWAKDIAAWLNDMAIRRRDLPNGKTNTGKFHKKDPDA